MAARRMMKSLSQVLSEFVKTVWKVQNEEETERHVNASTLGVFFFSSIGNSWSQREEGWKARQTSKVKVPTDTQPTPGWTETSH